MNLFSFTMCHYECRDKTIDFIKFEVNFKVNDE